MLLPPLPHAHVARSQSWLAARSSSHARRARCLAAFPPDWLDSLSLPRKGKADLSLRGRGEHAVRVKLTDRWIGRSVNTTRGGGLSPLSVATDTSIQLLSRRELETSGQEVAHSPVSTLKRYEGAQTPKGWISH